MTDDTKKRTNLDLSPRDIAPSYTGSSFNQGSANSKQIASDDPTLGAAPFHPGSLGARVMPGEGGFANAHTPQLTIFLQKKQWVEGEWTYVTNSTDERLGKIQEIKARLILGNLIARKIDLLNEHEIMTKFSEMNAASAGIQQSQSSDLQRGFVGGKEPVPGKYMADILTLAGSPVTRYYTETITLQNPDVITTKQVPVVKPNVVEIKLATQIETSTQTIQSRLLIRNKPGLNGTVIGGLAPGTSVVTAINPEGSKDLLRYDNKVLNIAETPPAGIPEQYLPELPKATWWAIDIDKVTDSQMKDGIQGGATTAEELKKLGIKIGSFNVGFVAVYVGGVTSGDQLSYYINKLQPAPFNFNTESFEAKTTKTPGESLGTYKNVFNGVIELANVTTANASCSNISDDRGPGRGSANFTIENPENILIISEDDIEIALGTRSVEGEFAIKEDIGGLQTGSKIVTTDPLTGNSTELYYHNGKFYTQSAFSRVTKQELSALGSFSNNTDIDKVKKEIQTIENDTKALQNYKNSGLMNDEFFAAKGRNYPVEPLSFLGEGLEKELAKYRPDEIDFSVVDVASQLPDAVSEFIPKYDPLFRVNTPKVNNKIELLIRRRNVLLQALDQLRSSDFLKLKEDKNTAYIRSQLKKYYLNRTIFEVYDKVFIWSTSPSRTTSKLEDGTLVSEASNQNASTQILFNRIKEIISLITQLENTVVQLSNGQRTIFSSKIEQLQSINEELYRTQSSETWTAIDEKITEAFTPGLVAGYFGASFDPTIQSLQKTIKLKIADLAVFGFWKMEGGKLNTATQSLDPTVFFEENSLAGIEEQQFQIFEGLVTSVQRKYSDGVFSISIDCSDVLNYLERSRYISQPTAYMDFSVTKARRFMDDPLWRPVRDERMIKAAEKNEGVKNLAGRWKTGIFTASAKLFQSGKDEEKQEVQQSQQNKKDPTILDDANLTKLTAPFGAFEEPFRSADPATILSILITGQPFDPALWLENNKSLGPIASAATQDGVKKDDEKIKVSAFQAIRKEKELDSRKSGNFEPFIDISNNNITAEEKQLANVKSAINLGNAIISFVNVYISTRTDVFSSVVETVKTQEAQENGTGIFKKITENNINQILAFDKKVFPKTVDQISLVAGSLGDARLEYWVKAAILGRDYHKIDDVLNQLTSPSEDVQRFKQFVSSVTDSTVNLFHNDQGAKYTLSIADASQYESIVNLARSRATRGAVFDIIFDTEGNNVAELVANPKFPEASLDENEKRRVANLRGITLSEDGKKIVSGSPLITTKASIIFNQKPNYFTLDSTYFNSPNLVDYVEKIRPNPAEYQQDKWSTVLERASKAAKVIDWEFYADTQGHIRFKAPTYNRTLLRHLLDIDSIDSLLQKPFFKVFKDNNLLQALEAVYLKQLQVAVQEARQKCILQIERLLKKAQDLIVEESSFSPSALLGLSSPLNILGYMIDEDVLSKKDVRFLRALIKLPNSSSVPSNNFTSTDEFKITKFNPEVIIADISQAKNTSKPESLDIALEYLEFFSISALGSVDEDIATYEEQLKAKEIKGNLVSQAAAFFDNLLSTVDPDSVSKSIKDALGNLVFVIDACDNTYNLVSTALAAQEGDISTIFQYLTDEKFIHVISNSIIVSETYNETPPKFTRLDLFSTLPFIGLAPSQVSQDVMQWAGSVDFDLWRIYGYIESEKMVVPFLREASQAVLYGHQLMARQYHSILTGDIAVIGDSKYQPGDTVFIEDENIYYYVTKVSHSFSYGSSYTTSLTLRYGRHPNTWIPYPFDILGSSLISGVQGLYLTDGTDLSQMLQDYDKQNQGS